MPTVRQRRGSIGEDVAADYLCRLGWTVVARNVKVGAHDEIDLVAVDDMGELVCVEVRSGRSSAFGAPEERVDGRKVGHLYRAARTFALSGEARRLGVGGRKARVDLVVVDLRGGTPVIRHLREVAPS